MNYKTVSPVNNKTIYFPYGKMGQRRTRSALYALPVTNRNKNIITKILYIFKLA